MKADILEERPTILARHSTISVNTSSYPILGKYIDQVTSLPKGGSDEAGRLKAVIDGILSTGSHECAAVVKDELDRVFRDPTYFCNRVYGDGLFTLFQDSQYILAIQLTVPSDTTEHRLSSTISMRAVGLYGNHGLVSFRKYDLPKSWNSEIYDPEIELLLSEQGTLSPVGNRSTVFFANSAVSLSTLEPSVLLWLCHNRSDAYTWYFDESTKRPTAVAPTSTTISRYRVIVEMIAALANEQEGDKRVLVDSLRKLFDSPYYFVRMKALQSLLAIDPEAGKAALESAYEDPHPDVRQAVKLLLARLRSAS